MTEATTRVAPASAGARITTYLIDLVAVVGIAAFAWPLTHSWVVLAVVAIEGVIVLSLARAATGRTPGALLTRTAGYAEGSDRAPGLRRQAIRSLLFAALHLTVVGPAATVATTREGRDWVDRIAGTAVADLRPRAAPATLALDPYGRATTAAAELPIAAPRPAKPAPSTAQLPGAGAQPRRALDEPVTEPSIPETRPVPGRALSAWPGAVRPPAASEVAELRACIVLDSGAQYELDAVLVLGREPETADPGERIVAIADPGRSLSRTHLRLGADAVGVWVEDAFSANGTSCRTPDGQLNPVPAGRRTHVPSGTTVLMGDRTLVVQA